MLACLTHRSVLFSYPLYHHSSFFTSSSISFTRNAHFKWASLSRHSASGAGRCSFTVHAASLGLRMSEPDWISLWWRWKRKSLLSACLGVSGGRGIKGSTGGCHDHPGCPRDCWCSRGSQTPYSPGILHHRQTGGPGFTELEGGWVSRPIVSRHAALLKASFLSSSGLSQSLLFVLLTLPTQLPFCLI